MSRRAPILLLAFLLAGGAALTSLAQERMVIRNGEGRAAIFEDDLDSARRRAVRQARDAAVQDILRQLLAPEWLELYYGDIKRRILARLDRYIGAYRVRRLEASLDRTQYTASVEAQVDRSRLVTDLRELGLPIVGDRPRSVAVLYDGADPLLAPEAVRSAALAVLGERLALLNIVIGDVRPAPSADVALLASPFSRQAARKTMLARHDPQAPVALYLFSETRAAAEGKTAITLKANFYNVGSGALLAALEQPARGKISPSGAGAAASVVKALAEPLALQFLPGRIGDASAWSTSGERLVLTVLGLQSIYDQETFERDFFRAESPFGDFVLSRVAADTVAYEGVYRGDRARLESDWSGKTVGEFRIRAIYWRNTTLELLVARKEYAERGELLPFPPQSREPMVTRLIEEMMAERPEMDGWASIYTEQEDNSRFDRANPIRFDALIYGFVDSRNDADVYVGEALQPGESLDIEWYRLGRTNLHPALRIYDENGHLAETYHPGGELLFQHSIPKGQHRIYLELGDRYGYLESDAGGYLNYHYLLRIRRRVED